MKIGAVTVGQAPRVDLTPDILPLLGEKIEFIERGALDHITPEEILQIQPEDGDYVLVSRMKDGSQVRFAERKILDRIQEAIEDLQNQGAECILMLCTGKFLREFHSPVPLLYPYDLLGAIVPLLAGSRDVAVMIPDKSQEKQCAQRWSRLKGNVTVVSGSPYRGIEGVREAAERIKGGKESMVILDCMGYTQEMKREVSRITGKPVILPRTLLARVVREYVGE
ncbi:MAG: AroM family protein [Blautia sp.]